MLLRFQIGDGYDASMPVHLSVDASGTMTTYARCVCGYGGVAAWLCCCVCVCGCVAVLGGQVVTVAWDVAAGITLAPLS